MAAGREHCGELIAERRSSAQSATGSTSLFTLLFSLLLTSPKAI